MRRMLIVIALSAAGCAGEVDPEGDAGVVRQPSLADSIETACARARQESKIVFLIFESAGDYDCRKFETTLEAPDVAPLLDRFVVARVEVFRKEGQDPTFIKLGFSSVPSIAFVTPDMQVIETRLYGPNARDFSRLAQAVLDRH